MRYDCLRHGYAFKRGETVLYMLGDEQKLWVLPAKNEQEFSTQLARLIAAPDSLILQSKLDGTILTLHGLRTSLRDRLKIHSEPQIWLTYTHKYFVDQANQTVEKHLGHPIDEYASSINVSLLEHDVRGACTVTLKIAELGIRELTIWFDREGLLARMQHNGQNFVPANSGKLVPAPLNHLPHDYE